MTPVFFFQIKTNKQYSSLFYIDAQLLLAFVKCKKKMQPAANACGLNAYLNLKLVFPTLSFINTFVSIYETNKHVKNLFILLGMNLFHCLSLFCVFFFF